MFSTYCHVTRDTCDVSTWNKSSTPYFFIQISFSTTFKNLFRHSIFMNFQIYNNFKRLLNSLADKHQRKNFSKFAIKTLNLCKQPSIAPKALKANVKVWFQFTIWAWTNKKMKSSPSPTPACQILVLWSS